MNNPQETMNQQPFIDLQSTDPEHAVTFKKFADIPTRFTSTLKRFSCTHAIFPNNENALICLKGTNTIKDLLDSFFGHHFKAIPIVDEAKRPQNVISQVSLLKALVPFLMEHNKNSSTSDIQEFLQRRIEDVPEVLERPVILPQASYAFDAFQMMQKHPNQRILIVNNLEENILTNLVSETRLTEVLSNLVDDMEDALKNAPIEKVIQNKTQVSCEIVNCQASVLEAFCLLASKNLESVAVVGENGKLLSVLTPADIKGVGADLRGVSLLQEPVEAFLQHIRNPHELEEIKPNVIACHLQDTVHNLLKKFVYWKVHRVLVADQEEHFVTDITLLDVMTYFQDHEHTIPEEHHVHEHRAVNFVVNVQ